MNRESILSGNSRQYISVSDCDMLAQIAKLLPFYKSFNALANDALAYGLPILIEKKFGEVKYGDEEQQRPQQNEQTLHIVERIVDERADKIARLLQEVIMNTTISKSLVCSLFNAKNAELNGKPLSGQRFDEGGLRYTPNCMEKYEVDRLNEMDGDEDDD